MNAFIVGILKIIFAITILAIGFWPDGPGFYVMRHFNEMPALYSAIIAVWVAALALNLPLDRMNFAKVSTVSIIVVFSTMIYKMWEKNYFDPSNKESWMITMIFLVGIIIGWWTVSSKVWRWYRNLMPVDDADTSDD